MINKWTDDHMKKFIIAIIIFSHTKWSHSEQKLRLLEVEQISSLIFMKMLFHFLTQVKFLQHKSEEILYSIY